MEARTPAVVTILLGLLAALADVASELAWLNLTALFSACPKSAPGATPTSSFSISADAIEMGIEDRRTPRSSGNDIEECGQDRQNSRDFFAGEAAKMGRLPERVAGLCLRSNGKDDYPQSRFGNWLDFGRDKREGSPWPHGASAVSSDGERFVAVWERRHIVKTVGLIDSDLLASRVEGWRPLDPAGVPMVASSGVEELNPALASDGGGKLVCVYEKRTRDGRAAIVARHLATR